MIGQPFDDFIVRFNDLNEMVVDDNEEYGENNPPATQEALATYITIANIVMGIGEESNPAMFYYPAMGYEDGGGLNYVLRSKPGNWRLSVVIFPDGKKLHFYFIGDSESTHTELLTWTIEELRSTLRELLNGRK